MIQLYASPWRPAFEKLLLSARTDLALASPFIKAVEAEWVCEILARRSKRSEIHLQVLTDVRTDSVLSGSLDIRALKIFSAVLPHTTIVNLPRLHAKVYIADQATAIVGSSNLTPSGLDANYEYGVGITEPALVARIRADLQAYARLGNILSPQVLDDLSLLGDKLVREYRSLQESVGTNLRRRFSQALRRANVQFVRAQVGSRSANSLFSEVISYVLSAGPLTTQELHPRVQMLLPDLCDDRIELIINGERFGKRWKHAVRNAQQYLKRRGVIEFTPQGWRLTSRAKQVLETG